MLGMGWGEWLIIMAALLLLFGASRLPEIGKGLGSGIQEFRKSVKGDPGGGDKELPKGDGEADAPKE